MNNSCYCPECAGPALQMEQKDLWACMQCQKIWRIANWIKEQYERAQASMEAPPTPCTAPPDGKDGGA